MEFVNVDIFSHIIMQIQERQRYTELYKFFYVSKHFKDMISNKMAHIWDEKKFHSEDISGVKFCNRLKWSVKCEDEISYRYLDLIVKNYKKIDIVELVYDVYNIKYNSLICVLENKKVQETLETIKINRCQEIETYDFNPYYNKIYNLLLKCKNLKEVVWYFDTLISEERTELEMFELYNMRNPKNYDFCLVWENNFGTEGRRIEINITPRKYFETKGHLFYEYFSIDNDLFKKFDHVECSGYNIWISPEHSYNTLVNMGMKYNEKLTCGMQLFY